MQGPANLVLQIEDILVGDKQLAKEIMYDMKQAELAKQGHPAASAPQAAPAQTRRQGSAVPEQPHGGEMSAAPACPMPGLSPRGGQATRQSQSRMRPSSGLCWILYGVSGCSCMCDAAVIPAARVIVHPIRCVARVVILCCKCMHWKRCQGVMFCSTHNYTPLHMVSVKQKMILPLDAL